VSNPPTPPSTVAITGISGALGRRVVAQLAERSDWRVIGLDPLPFPAGVPKPRYFTVHRVDVATTTGLARLLQGASVLVHLATGEPDGPTAVDDEVRLLGRTLDAAAVAGVDRIVVLSSAAVYGAWIDNPVPLTEEAPLRPHVPGFGYADQKLALERALDVWLADHPNARAVVLRPAVTLGHPDARAWLAKATRPPLAARLSHEIAHQQYVHVDDLAAGVRVAFEALIDGRLAGRVNVLNVAADGWLTPEDAQELFGPSTRLPTDGPVGQGVLGLVRRVFDGDRPAGVEPYLAWPWVVANDRLRSLGWAPRSSNAEALVASQRPLPGSRFVARHRQEVTLAAVGVVGTAVSGLVVWLVRRWVRRR
jgi:nucleoside-diphosphate-sugar epimerase